jgi:hypothetical protein
MHRTMRKKNHPRISRGDSRKKPDLAGDDEARSR